MEGFNYIQLNQIREIVTQVVSGVVSNVPDAVSIKEAARITGKSKRTIERRIKAGLVQTFKNKGDVLKIPIQQLKEI